MEARKRAAIKKDRKLTSNDDIKSEEFVKDENNESEEVNDEDGDDDDESDDEDFDPDASDEDASGRDSDDSGDSDEYSSASENEDESPSIKKMQRKRSPKKSGVKVPHNHLDGIIAGEEEALEDKNDSLSGSIVDIKTCLVKSEPQECTSPREESVRKKVRTQSPQSVAKEVANIKEENIELMSD